MEPEVSGEEIIRFGEFELALKSGELRRNGRVVRLQPQPFKVLAFLATHAGQTVTRQELQHAVWDGETFVDFEHGLNFCIKQIRSALGDNAQTPRIVETLPKRGYRFIPEVERLNGKQTAETVINEPAEARSSVEPRQRAIQFPARRIAAIGVIAGVALAGVYFTFGFLARRNPTDPVPLAVRVMIAVMPFENLSGDPEQAYFSDGMTEEMIARLGGLNPDALGVIARTSVMGYKGGNKDIGEIGRELGVDFVVEGSVRRDQDRVRITAQLIRVSDQTHLWSESYDRPAKDALTVQAEVSNRIANALTIELLREREQGSAQPGNADAVDAYLRGRYLWNKGNRESVARSVEQFNRAIELDAGYAPAYCGLADSYRLLGMYYVTPPRDAYPRAKEAATRAIELDPDSADALVSLGTIRFRYEWNWAEAERDFLRAIEINPSLGMAHHDYAWFLIAMGRFDEGIHQMKLAQRLDPLSPVANSDVGWAFLMARRYDEAISQIERTLELEPDFKSALACLERAYLLQGRHREAKETLMRELGETSPAASAGDPAAEMELLYSRRLERTLETARKGRSSPYNVATVCLAAGRQDQALAWLERAFEERDPMLVAVRTDPAFDAIRADPRFVGLLRRIGFPN
jgi:TolB-like protein/DNA-binding winged helix-turn-helix (wHTH) protein/Tfp pilus assembly protein PilF